MIESAVYLTFLLVLSIFLGFEVISKVPSTLHTPLMSGSNAKVLTLSIIVVILMIRPQGLFASKVRR